MNAPCRGCADRHPLCHADCPRYLEFRAERDRFNTERQAEKQLTWDVNQNALRALRVKLIRYKRDH